MERGQLEFNMNYDGLRDITAQMQKMVNRISLSIIIGATIVARHAGEMINEFTLAMTAGLGPGAIGRTIHPYPTQAEAVKKLASTK